MALCAQETKSAIQCNIPNKENKVEDMLLSTTQKNIMNHFNHYECEPQYMHKQYIILLNYEP